MKNTILLLIIAALIGGVIWHLNPEEVNEPIELQELSDTVEQLKTGGLPIITDQEGNSQTIYGFLYNQIVSLESRVKELESYGNKEVQ